MNDIENINKKIHVTACLINVKTIQEHFETMNHKDINSEEEKQDIAEFLDSIDKELDSIKEKMAFIRQI